MSTAKDTHPTGELTFTDNPFLKLKRENTSTLALTNKRARVAKAAAAAQVELYAKQRATVPDWGSTKKSKGGSRTRRKRVSRRKRSKRSLRKRKIRHR